MAATPDDIGWSRLRRPRRWLVSALLVAPVLAVLAVPLYSRAEPSLGGVPFFYWSQFVAVPLTMLAMAAALRLLRPSGHGRDRAPGVDRQQDP